MQDETSKTKLLDAVTHTQSLLCQYISCRPQRDQQQLLPQSQQRLHHLAEQKIDIKIWNIQHFFTPLQTIQINTPK